MREPHDDVSLFFSLLLMIPQRYLEDLEDVLFGPVSIYLHIIQQLFVSSCAVTASRTNTSKMIDVSTATGLSITKQTTSLCCRDGIVQEQIPQPFSESSLRVDMAQMNLRSFVGIHSSCIYILYHAVHGRSVALKDKNTESMDPKAGTLLFVLHCTPSIQKHVYTNARPEQYYRSRSSKWSRFCQQHPGGRSTPSCRSYNSQEDGPCRYHRCSRGRSRLQILRHD